MMYLYGCNKGVLFISLNEAILFTCLHEFTYMKKSVAKTFAVSFQELHSLDILVLF